MCFQEWNSPSTVVSPWIQHISNTIKLHSATGHITRPSMTAEQMAWYNSNMTKLRRETCQGRVRLSATTRKWWHSIVLAWHWSIDHEYRRQRLTLPNMFEVYPVDDPSRGYVFRWSCEYVGVCLSSTLRIHMVGCLEWHGETSTVLQRH